MNRLVTASSAAAGVFPARWVFPRRARRRPRRRRGTDKAFYIVDPVKAALEAREGALRRVTLIDAPRGPVSFDEYGHPVEEHLRPKYRPCRRQAAEHRHPHASERVAVLDVQARGVPEDPRLLSRL